MRLVLAGTCSGGALPMTARASHVVGRVAADAAPVAGIAGFIVLAPAAAQLNTAARRGPPALAETHRAAYKNDRRDTAAGAARLAIRESPSQRLIAMWRTGGEL